MSDKKDKLARMDDPRLAETEVPKESGGTLFPSSGIALIHHGDALYMINLSADPIVQKLTGREPLHMYNLHTDHDTFKIAPDEIGDPPFPKLVERLEAENELARYLLGVDSLLDPLEDSSLRLRYLYAKGIEVFLRKYPAYSSRLVEKIFAFIPPEEYEMRLEDILKASQELEEDDLKHQHEGRNFSETFPLLFQVLHEAQFFWGRNAELHAPIRLTRKAIQEHNDRRAERMSEGFFRRTQEMFYTFTACLADIKVGKGIEKWKMDICFGDAGKLKDAKGNLLLYSKNLSKDKPLFEEAAKRKPHILERYKRAVKFIEDSQPLLVEIESILGEIKATKFLA